MFFMGLVGRKEKAGMRRSSSLDVLAPPLPNGMGERRTSYNMLHNIASLVMSVSVPGHERPFAIQAQHDRQLDGYVGDPKPSQLEFYIKRKNPPPPGERGREGGGRRGESGIVVWHGHVHVAELSKSLDA